MYTLFKQLSRFFNGSTCNTDHWSQNTQHTIDRTENTADYIFSRPFTRIANISDNTSCRASSLIRQISHIGTIIDHGIISGQSDNSTGIIGCYIHIAIILIRKNRSPSCFSNNTTGTLGVFTCDTPYVHRIMHDTDRGITHNTSYIRILPRG